MGSLNFVHVNYCGGRQSSTERGLLNYVNTLLLYIITYWNCLVFIVGNTPVCDLPRVLQLGRVIGLTNRK